MKWKLEGGRWHLYERDGRKLVPAMALQWVRRKGRRVQIMSRVSVDPGRAFATRLAGIAILRTPEARLWLAVIEQAAKDLGLRESEPGTEAHLDYTSARAFFRGRRFRNICETIGLSAEGVIRAALSMGVAQRQDRI